MFGSMVLIVPRLVGREWRLRHADQAPFLGTLTVWTEFVNVFGRGLSQGAAKTILRLHSSKV